MTDAKICNMSIQIDGVQWRTIDELARESGVSEIWLFGVNGLSADVVSMLHDELPLDKRP